MEETYLPAFEGLVKEAKVEAVMGAITGQTGNPAAEVPHYRKNSEANGNFRGILYQTAGRSVIFTNTIW